MAGARHGLGTGSGDAIHALADRVELRPAGDIHDTESNHDANANRDTNDDTDTNDDDT